MRWHTADFDTLDWRGVHVHGWRVVERGPGEADLTLDIDWILARPQSGGTGTGRTDERIDGTMDASIAGHAVGGHAVEGYAVAQAMLVFHDVAGLRFILDYAACSAASGPFSIETVHREPLGWSGPGPDGADDDGDDGDDYGEGDDYGPWRWRIDLAWPEGELAFEAGGFSQWLVGEPQMLDGPVLPAALRS